jgi:hypothetical protein
MTVLQPKTRVHVLSFVGASFEPCWKEKGTVLKPTARQKPPSSEWSIVRFDDGGTMCIHRERLMVANDQSAAA